MAEIKPEEIDWQEAGFQLRYAMEQAAAAVRGFVAVYEASVQAEVDRRVAHRRAESKRRETTYAAWKARREADHA